MQISRSVYNPTVVCHWLRPSAHLVSEHTCHGGETLYPCAPILHFLLTPSSLPASPKRGQLTTHMLSFLWICLFWTFYKWNHIIRGLLGLASFTSPHVFKVHSCCAHPSFIPLHYWVTSRCTDTRHLLRDSSVEFELFPLFPSYESCCFFNICVQVFVWAFISFWIYAWELICWSYGNYI